MHFDVFVLVSEVSLIQNILIEICLFVKGGT
jgi:hypothetical protein